MGWKISILGNSFPLWFVTIDSIQLSIAISLSKSSIVVVSVLEKKASILQWECHQSFHFDKSSPFTIKSS